MRPILTLEDGTHVLDTTGDLDAFEYGGGVLFQEPKRREIYWQFWGPRETGDKNYFVFTAPVPPNVIELFQPDIQELCKYSELEIQKVRRMSRSKDPKERLQIVIAIRDVYGPSAIDPNGDPEVITLSDLVERWGSVFGKDMMEIPEVEYDDYIIRETQYGNWECGCVDGTYFGRFDKYKHCLCAIAEHMREVGTMRPNVMHEHGPGKLELVVWDPTEFLDKTLSKRRGTMPGPRWRAHVRKYANDQVRAEGIAKRNSRQKSIMKKRKRAKQKLMQRDTLERARAMRRNMEKLYP